MNAVLRVIVFDVEHGACVFIKTPTGHGLMIDCGRKDRFSPARYIATHEASGLTPHNGHILTKLVVTHPHDDHIEDIDNVKTLLPPAILLRQHYVWEQLKIDPRGDYSNLDSYVAWQQTYNQPATAPDLGIELGAHSLSPAEAGQLGESSFVNNSSFAIVVRYQGPRYSWKFLIGGDLESTGWKALLARPHFREAVKGTAFFIVSHHGHTSGYYKELFDAFGARPIVNIASVHRKDESVDPAYSREDHAMGVNLAGQTRRMMSTRSDGSIVVEIDDTDQYSVYPYRLVDNE